MPGAKPEGAKMQSHSAAAAVQAAIALIGRTLQTLRDKNLFSEEEARAVIDGAIRDVESLPAGADSAAVIKDMVKAERHA
jgi:hypothetical protein